MQNSQENIIALGLQLYEKLTPPLVFFYEYYEIFKNAFSTKQIWGTDSVVRKLLQIDYGYRRFWL